jgi:hypothetical protein
MLLQELGMIEEIVFVHPSDMQTGKIQVKDKDITTNLPYTKGVFLALITMPVKPSGASSFKPYPCAQSPLSGPRSV